MGTLAALKARIASELNRTDLTSTIADQIPRAIEFYAARRFWFNESTGTATTTAGVSTVTAPAGLRVLDCLFITIGAQKLELDEESPSVIEDWLGSNAGEGQPTDFAKVGSTFKLYRTPNDAYTLTAVGIFDQAALETDGSSNAWTTEAEDLIAYHVIDRIARTKARNVALANEARGFRDEALSQLRAETTRRLSNRIQPA